MPEDLLAGHLTPWRVWDRGGARPVLALHCSLAHAGAWTGLTERLRGVTVTAMDQPGHGRAADWDGQTNLHDLTTRIAVELAERLGSGEPIDLFGHSFGGTICLRIAQERPELVRSLMLVEPVIFAAAKELPVYPKFWQQHQTFARMMQSDRPESARMFHAAFGSGEAWDDLPERARSYIIDRIHHIPAQNAALLDDAAGLTAAGALEAIKVPVLLVEGADSPPIINAVQSVLTARLRRTARLIVPGAGHMVSITHPDLIAHSIQAHLEAS